MFETIKRIYAKTGDKAVVKAAVERKPKAWISEEQYQEITGEAYKK